MLIVLVVQNCIVLGCNVGVVIVVCKAVSQGQGGYDGVAGRSVRKLGLALL